MDDNVEVPPAPPAPTPPVPVVMQLLAAIAVGVVFAGFGLRIATDTPLPNLLPGYLHYPALGPAALAVTVALATAIRRPGGWVVSTVGLALVGAERTLIGAAARGLSDRQLVYWVVTDLLLAVGFGLTVGGVLTSVARADSPAARAWIAAGLAGGTALSAPLLGVADALLGRDETAVRGAGLLYVGVAGLLSLVAAAVGSGSDRARATESGRAWFGPALAVTTVAALALAANQLRRAVSARIAVVDRYSLLAVAVLVGVLLAGYAYRRDRATGARLVLLGFATAGAVVFTLRQTELRRAPDVVLVTVVGVLAVLAGVVAARYADRWFPWDALGVCVAACGVLAGTEVVRRHLAGAGTAQSVLTAAGLSLALSSAWPAPPVRPAPVHPPADRPITFGRRRPGWPVRWRSGSAPWSWWRR